MKRIFIVNPIAGNGKALKMGKTLKEICDSEKLKYEIIYTTGTDCARNIAKQHRSECRENIVYSVGGDGTLNEVVNGVVNSNTILGVIPGGTGNNFYKMIKPNDQRARKIDVGKVNDHYFINIASLGLDAKIAERANKIKNKFLSNKLVYYMGIACELINLESTNLKIDDRTKDKEFTMLSVCNGAYYGGGFKLAPSASIFDGAFEIYEVSRINLLQALKLFKLLLNKQHENSKFVDYWKTDYFTVESTVPLICNVDGEIITDQKFIFENIEEGLQLLYNDHPKIMSSHKKLGKC